MSYLPQSERDRAAMLKALGLKTVEELFAQQIPASLRTGIKTKLPAPLTEIELLRHMRVLADQNRSLEDLVCFAGGGLYDRFIPSLVQEVINRPAFKTGYTPYQAEASQGILQALFEFQSMVSALTGLPIANASLYDGASSVGEAVLLAHHSTRRPKALLSRALAPAARALAYTYGEVMGVQIIEVPYLATTGETDLEALEQLLDEEVSCVVLQQPNYFGVLEDMTVAGELAHHGGALLIASVEPTSLAILAPPGDYGADLAVGEGQALGLPPSYGGPLLGLFACTQKLLRQMPGRVVGKTTDSEGRTGYCLTLQTREQHIRREKATSNICTSESLCALASSVYLAALGPAGLREVAEQSAQKAHFLAELLSKSEAVQPRFTGAFCNELVLRMNGEVSAAVKQLVNQGYLVGPTLERDYPELGDCLLVAVTEQRTRVEIEALASALGAK